MTELAAEGVPRERLGLIYNGDRPGRLRGPPARLARSARASASPPTALVLTTPANLIPYKGHADLLDALARVAGQLPPDWVLLCAGRDDGAGPALRARAQALGFAERVRWLGLRDDVPALLVASDVGILASHEEGFSNSVLEGMAAGVAMIVSDVGGNAEAVQHGVSGCVVPPRDPAALGAAILAARPRSRRGGAAWGTPPARGSRRPSAWTAAWPDTSASTSWWPAAAPTRSARRWRRSCRDRLAPAGRSVRSPARRSFYVWAITFGYAAIVRPARSS